MAGNRESYSNLEVAPTEHTTQHPQILDDPALHAPEVSDTPTIDDKDKWPLKDVCVI